MPWPSDTLAYARPKRGKWHRAKDDDANVVRWACSDLGVRINDEVRPVAKTAEEDRCRLCWNA